MRNSQGNKKLIDKLHLDTLKAWHDKLYHRSIDPNPKVDNEQRSRAEQARECIENRINKMEALCKE